MREIREYDENDNLERYFPTKTDIEDILRKCNEKLDSDVIFRLHFDEGKTQQEIAEILRVSKGTISNRVQFHGWEARHPSKKRELKKDEEISDDLIDLQDLREKADYHYKHVISEKTAKDTLNLALSVVKNLDELFPEGVLPNN